MIEVINKDCMIGLKELSDNSVDSVVTDPPYGMKFMNKKWDYNVPGIEMWKECLRILKPGGHILVACGTKTQHRMAINIENAGFEIRDLIAWIYSQGFPKNTNVSKKITKNMNQNKARQWEGWGTALKPALELWTLARKPLSEKTIADNILKWGTGGLNIDKTRVPVNEKLDSEENLKTSDVVLSSKKGRYPSNVIHDGSDDVFGLFPKTKKGWGKNTTGIKKGLGSIFGIGGYSETERYDSGSGSAARFFYCAKPSKSERNIGLDDFPEKIVTDGSTRKNKKTAAKYQANSAKRKNIHPTVKPVKLMRYLCKLVTPPNGIVVDPFMGSGSTGIAALVEGFNFIGFEIEKEYFNLAKARIDYLVFQLGN